MINPSAVKGISIFLALADRFRGYQFGALRGWGTTEQDLAALKSRPNIVLLPKVKRIEQVLMRTKLLLMPALWYEGFGLIVMEAMLRGVPVLASDMGSLVEAKAGTNYVLPVRPIERYRTVFDENRMPIPVVPTQDIEPWARALAELMENQVLYRAESDAARAAAMRFVPTVKASRFEQFLLRLKPAVPENGTPAPAATTSKGRITLEDLSSGRRTLLLRALRERGKKE